MGLSGYSSMHWPPMRPSVSTIWHDKPTTPASKAAKSPTGPAPTIRTSVRMGVSVCVLLSEVIRYPFCAADQRVAHDDHHTEATSDRQRRHYWQPRYP